MIITIDGPVASGKTTIGFLLAKKLNNIKNFFFLDTGLIYRKYTYLTLQNQHNQTPNFSINQFKDLIVIPTNLEEFEQKIKYLFTEEIAILTSKQSQDKKIREYLTKIQKELVNNNNVVVVGRDSGTVVFKNAQFKFFLYASTYIRALRRYYQYKKTNPDLKLSYQEILNQIIQRDNQDKTRKYAPLPNPNNLPPDFILINTDNLNINETVEKMFSIITQNKINN